MAFPGQLPDLANIDPGPFRVTQLNSTTGAMHYANFHSEEHFRRFMFLVGGLKARVPNLPQPTNAVNVAALQSWLDDYAQLVADWGLYRISPDVRLAANSIQEGLHGHNDITG